MISPTDGIGQGFQPLPVEGELPPIPPPPPPGDGAAAAAGFGGSLVSLLETQAALDGEFPSFGGDDGADPTRPAPPPAAGLPAPASPLSPLSPGAPGPLDPGAVLAPPDSPDQPPATEPALQGFSQGSWATAPELLKQGVPLQALVTLPPGPDGQPREPQLLPVVAFRVGPNGREQVAVKVPVAKAEAGETAGTDAATPFVPLEARPAIGKPEIAQTATPEVQAPDRSPDGQPVVLAQLPRGAPRPSGAAVARSELAQAGEQAGVAPGENALVANGERVGLSDGGGEPLRLAGGRGSAADPGIVNPNIVLPFVLIWLDRRDDAAVARDRDRRSRRQGDEDADALLAGPGGSGGAIHEIRSVLDSIFGGWPTTVAKGIWNVGSFIVVGVAKLAWWGARGLARRLIRAVEARRSR